MYPGKSRQASESGSPFGKVREHTNWDAPASPVTATIDPATKTGYTGIISSHPPGVPETCGAGPPTQQAPGWGLSQTPPLRAQPGRSESGSGDGSERSASQPPQGFAQKSS